MSEFYKKIIRSRKVRLWILRLFSFLPDKWVLSLQYRCKIERWINWKNPQCFTEKIQLYKLYYKDPLLVRCVDKYDVREYVKSLGFENLLNECYGVYENVDDIDFDKLPQKFVIKDTLGGGGNGIIFCQDKEKLDIKNVKKVLQKWLNIPLVKDAGREWPYYSGKKHRILIEKFIESDASKGGLLDYKFFCCDGRSDYLWVITDRKCGESGCFGLFDRNFVKQPCRMVYERPFERDVPKPDNFDELIRIAEKLSKAFPQVRVDLFDVNGKIYFGEFTFYSCSGYMKIEPDEYDYRMGENFRVESFIPSK